MLTAALLIGCLTLTIGIALGLAAHRLEAHDDAVVEQINALLPQTQCGQCGYPGCRPYAVALAAGDARQNQCPPGGEATILALSRLLNQPNIPLDAAFGATRQPEVAVIAEDACIGCGLCLQACPVDAILGAPQYMYTVISSECTGCELCIAPCPVDCITLLPANDQPE
jgi:electron transport complex protein RnfB